MRTLANFKPGEAASSVRPFSVDRNGVALGEGAAFLILESSGRARQRGARAHATLSGWGVGCDAAHLSRPDTSGQARALRAASRHANVQAREVGYCNAHGTATPGATGKIRVVL